MVGVNYRLLFISINFPVCVCDLYTHISDCVDHICCGGVSAISRRTLCDRNYCQTCRSQCGYSAINAEVDAVSWVFFYFHEALTIIAQIKSLKMYNMESCALFLCCC